jgi:hypothetical protein
MERNQIIGLAQRWIKYHLLPKKKRTKGPLHVAWTTLDELVKDSPQDAWDVIMAIQELDSSDGILANLAAGPLEDLLCKHGEDFIDKVEVRARQDKVFLYLLTGVWRRDSMAKNVAERLNAVTSRAERGL